MAIYQPYNDTPNKIKLEGQQIALTLTKIGPTTAKLSWNIPVCVVGCDGLAYNGLLITVNAVPSTPQEGPINGTRYVSDPTVDGNLHAGDTISTALVVAALYDDVTSTSVTITGLNPTSAYYFSGYAVDAQNQYHTEGVHAYSQPLGGTDRPALPGYAEVQLGYQGSNDLFDIIRTGTATGVQLSAPTGLSTTNSYQFTIKTDSCGDATNCAPVTVTINGVDAQTFADLITRLNLLFTNLCANPALPQPPNVGCLYLKPDTCWLGSWNGSTYDEQTLLCQDADPNDLVDGMYWQSPITNILQQYNALSSPAPVWDVVQQWQYHKDPTNLNQSDYWFNGSIGYSYEGSTWCEHITYVQTIDPSLKAVMDSGTYWFNLDTNIMYSWSVECSKWIPIDVLYSESNPNTETNGLFWFDDVANILYIRDSFASPVPMWVECPTRYDVQTAEPTNPVVGTAWVDTATAVIKVRNLTDDGWDIMPSIFYHIDPMNRTSCQYWWDSTTDELNVWDSVNIQWVAVSTLIQSLIDPSLAPILAPQTLWYNPTTAVMLYWDGSEWIEKSVIYSNVDPSRPAIGNVWWNEAELEWKEWDGSGWIDIVVFYNAQQPGNVTAGTFWYSATQNTVVYFNGFGWVGVVFQTTSCAPALGFVYYNTTEESAYRWTSTGWRLEPLPVMVQLNEFGNLVFISNTLGSSSFVEVKDITLFGALSSTNQAYIREPVIGSDNIPGTPSFNVIGVGTDGTTDERRNMIMEIQHQLGHPSFKVELTKEQYDTAIRLALEEFRRRSASAYRREMFFLQIQPGKQKYELSNKAVGYHKITKVMAAYRIQSSFLGNATGQGVYGQAMLQHLYQMGSFDLVSYYIVSEYVELMNEMFAAYLVFGWNERTRELFFHQTFGSKEKVLLDVMIERTEQDLMSDRLTKTWIERFALGKCQLMLAEIRGRYGSLPGAGGGVTLNASDMQIRGEANLELCEQEIEEFIVNEIETVGMGGSFILG